MSKSSLPPSTNKPPAALLKFLKPYDRAVRDLALKLRSLIIEEMAPCYENIYDAYSAVAIGYGWSDRLKDGVFHIAVYSRHVNLGFNHGASMPDPLGILEGQGNQIRHIKISAPEDLARPELHRYIQTALKCDREDARKLGEKLPRVQSRNGNVISVVKAISPKKRRPV